MNAETLVPDEFLTAELGFPMFRRHRTPIATGRALPLDTVKKLRARYESRMNRVEACKGLGITWQTVDRYYRFWGDGIPKRKVTPHKRTAWMRSERTLLRQLYPSAYQEAIEKALPRHPWMSICRMASTMGVKRPKAKVTSAIEVIRDLRAARERRGITRKELAAKLGIHPQFIATWERGVGTPRFSNLIKWCGALGVALRIYDRVALNVSPVVGRFEPRKSS
jgi:HTH-type transcriptional regulator/antitoxin HipB